MHLNQDRLIIPFRCLVARMGEHPWYTPLANSDPEETWGENIKPQKNPRKQKCILLLQYLVCFNNHKEGADFFLLQNILQYSAWISSAT